jgi:hypothetical protein
MSSRTRSCRSSSAARSGIAWPTQPCTRRPGRSHSGCTSHRRCRAPRSSWAGSCTCRWTAGTHQRRDTGQWPCRPRDSCAGTSPCTSRRRCSDLRRRRKRRPSCSKTARSLHTGRSVRCRRRLGPRCIDCSDSRAGRCHRTPRTFPGSPRPCCTCCPPSTGSPDSTVRSGRHTYRIDRPCRRVRPDRLEPGYSTARPGRRSGTHPSSRRPWDRSVR